MRPMMGRKKKMTLVTHVPDTGGGVTTFTGAEVGASPVHKGMCVCCTSICRAIEKEDESHP